MKKKLFFLLLIFIIVLGCVSGGKTKEETKIEIDMNDPKLIIATKATNTIKIDGDTSEWEGVKSYLVSADMTVHVSGVEEVDESTTNLLSNFFIQWDDKYLYLACNVVDDLIVNNIAPYDNEALYRTDSVEFYIDTRKTGMGKGVYKIAVLPFDSEWGVLACRHEDSNSGPLEIVNPDAKVASKKTKDGYSIELAIPFIYLMRQSPKEGIVFGFSHAVHNSNVTDPVTERIGDYVRENMIAWNPEPTIWNRPDAWSNMILQ